MKHIAIIMDGNGRWARKRGLPRSAGHKAGTEAARKIVTECRKMGLSHLTLYTFSKENWSRPREEVSFLFDLLKDFLSRELPTMLEQSIRLRILGDIATLPMAARQVLKHAVHKTSGCTAMTLNLALNYSGRDEIVRACRNMLAAGTAAEDITEESFKDFLYTAGQPDPDLIIRTSGEIRLSNYLLYQSAYSELYFTDTLWPDFTPEHLQEAVAAFTQRNRRFGTTGEDPAS
jgi:undecaprenyl diphosphate synthase